MNKDTFKAEKVRETTDNLIADCVRHAESENEVFDTYMNALVRLYLDKHLSSLIASTYAAAVEEAKKVVPKEKEMTLDQINNGFVLRTAILAALSTLQANEKKG